MEFYYCSKIDMKMQARIVRMRDIHLDEFLFRNYLTGYKELFGCLSMMMGIHMTCSWRKADSLLFEEF